MRSPVLAAMFVLSMLTLPVAWSAEVEREIPMKDGTTLIIFKDGKMAMRDPKGRTLSMKENHPMETKDGKVIMMRGNELWRRTQSEKERDDLYRGS